MREEVVDKVEASPCSAASSSLGAVDKAVDEVLAVDKPPSRLAQVREELEAAEQGEASPAAAASRQQMRESGQGKKKIAEQRTLAAPNVHRRRVSTSQELLDRVFPRETQCIDRLRLKPKRFVTGRRKLWRNVTHNTRDRGTGCQEVLRGLAAFDVFLHKLLSALRLGLLPLFLERGTPYFPRIGLRHHLRHATRGVIAGRSHVSGGSNTNRPATNF